MTALQVLKGARELISDQKRWTREESARDSSGNGVFAHSAAAVCWCADGALDRVAFNSKSLCREAFVILNESAMRTSCHGWEIVSVNDLEGHDAVLRAFDHAIARLEQNA